MTRDLGDGSGKYKIEIAVMEEKRNEYGVPGAIYVMKSNSALDGDGDEPLFFCPSCKGLIDPDHSKYGVFACVSCGKKGANEILSERIMFRLPYPKLAALAHKLWLQVEGDADMYLRRFKKSLRQSKEAERLGRRLNLQNRARSQRELVIYPLKNMIKDNLAGQDMQKQILVFLSA